MRTEKEILDLVIRIAQDDEKIRAVVMVGSRANPDVPKDEFQDYDIGYHVNDVALFYNNFGWIEKHFGKPVIMQLPEDMSPELFPPIGDGHFCALMVFEDSVRIDLSVNDEMYECDGEPAIVLLDKDNAISLNINEKFFHVKKPSKKLFHDCCNEFWWCLNNVVKGIARDELPYAMNMYNTIVRDMLHKMLEWHIGIEHDFAVSAGKNGKYFKRLLPQEIYAKYALTYSDSDYENFWEAVYIICGLFHEVAIKVAGFLDVEYNQDEENGMMKYMEMCRRAGNN
jgi:aminoglycoside 6-adenylyltransferase